MSARWLIRWLAALGLIILVGAAALVVSGGASLPAVPVAAGEQVSEAWLARYDGPSSGRDEGTNLVVDEAGNVYVTGASAGPGWAWDYATVKYSSDGQEQWAARYNGPDNGFDWAADLAVDAAGNVYVTGGSEGSNGHSDYVTIKYAADGSEQWVRRYNDPRGGNGAPALAVDGAGNVYVTGCTGSDTDGDYATIKYGPDGSEQWVRRYDGTGQYDMALALAVDGTGNVYVTGQSKGPDGYADYATIKYGPDGGEQWVRRYAGWANSWDLAPALAVDGAGNVYVTGWSRDSAAIHYESATIKYGPDGSEQWVRRYGGPAGSAWVGALAVDGAGNVYIAGGAQNTVTDTDYLTIKYGPDGSEQWVRLYDGPGNGSDGAHSLALDEAGNVYVTGESAGSDTERDYATIKYGPDGSELWVARYSSPTGYYYDSSRAVALDRAGNVYVTGVSWGGSTDDDYATVKYQQDVDGDGMPDTYEEVHSCLDPALNDAAGDPDADGVNNVTEYGLDSEPCVSDTDRDACSDGKEVSMGFSPLAWYDFYDVPTPASADLTANGPKNKAVTMSDVLAVLRYVGTSDGDGGVPNPNGVAYDSVKGSCDWNADTVADKEGLCFDRSPSLLPNPPWDAGPPSSAVNMADVLGVLAQVGLSCTGSP